MTAPALPGTLADLLGPGVAVYVDHPGLHTEIDPDLWRVRGGTIVTVSNDTVTTVTPNRHAAGGVQRDSFPVDAIHNCDGDFCGYRPRLARPADARWVARRLLRLVAQRRGPFTDDELRDLATATTLLTQGLL